METDDAATWSQLSRQFTLRHTKQDVAAKLAIIIFGLVGSAGIGLMIWAFFFRSLVVIGQSPIERALTATIVSAVVVILAAGNAFRYLDRLERNYREGGVPVE